MVATASAQTSSPNLTKLNNKKVAWTGGSEAVVTAEGEVRRQQKSNNLDLTAAAEALARRKRLRKGVNDSSEVAAAASAGW